MSINRIITLGALALGVVFAVPAFGQEAQGGGCIHFQQNCSDAPYPVTEHAARPSGRTLYNVVPRVAHRDMQKTGAAEGTQKIQNEQHGYRREPLFNYVPQQNAVQPCIHVQSYCL